MSSPIRPGNTPHAFEPVASDSPRFAEQLGRKTGQLLDDVQDEASRVAQRAGDGAASLGQRIGEAATTVRDKLPESVAPYADRATAAVKRAAQSVSEVDLKAYGEDMSAVVRRHPLPAVLTGVAVGFLLARASRR